MIKITGSENCPRDASTPANGITSSEVIGTSVLSSVISRNRPGYPTRLTKSVTNCAR